MAIKLDIQPYCECCMDFEADVTKPNKIYANDEIVLGNTIIRCAYARRCENIRNYFVRLDKESIKTIPIDLA